MPNRAQQAATVKLAVARLDEQGVDALTVIALTGISRRHYYRVLRQIRPPAGPRPRAAAAAR